MEDVNRTPREAKDYYSRSIWLSETAQAFGNLKRSDRDNVNGRDSYGYNFQEIVTPEVSGAFDEIKGLIRVNDEVIGEEENGDYGHYSRQSLTTEIVEIVEDGKSISNKDRRVDDLYVAVGKDDLNVVKWALDHAVSPGSRIFLIHVSSPITLIPTPVGKFERSQLTPQQVRLYVNEVNNKRKDLLQKYIQMSNEAKVTAETLLLESNDKGKAILDLISILTITNIVIGIKKLPFTRRNNKLSKGEFIKKHAPSSCEVTLVYNGKVLVSDPYMNGLVSNGITSQNKSHLKNNFFQCMCFSGKFSQLLIFSLNSCTICGCVREDNGSS
ncbi:U-box domain-containing protein 36 [Glycine max]|uniref:U-box domain-containing protein 36 n=1 Tax=Glycine soja TaxID=3848 RepID=A0A445G414_GLYSO|nr:U-box domain-containing protein 36 [Glycine max]RZB55914.1 U-box domain-containing protein 36 [Glycine soja]